MLKKLEHVTIEKFERELGGGISQTSKMLARACDGDFCVEVHEGYTRYAPSPSGKMTTVEDATYGVLIFDHGFFVADLNLASYTPVSRVSSSLAYIRGQGYVRRAVKLLLAGGFIKEWVSFPGISEDAKNMYLSLAKDSYLQVSFDGKSYHVKLKR